MKETAAVIGCIILWENECKGKTEDTGTRVWNTNDRRIKRGGNGHV